MNARRNPARKSRGKWQTFLDLHFSRATPKSLKREMVVSILGGSTKNILAVIIGTPKGTPKPPDFPAQRAEAPFDVLSGFSFPAQ